MRRIGALTAAALLLLPLGAHAQNPSAFSADTSRIEPGRPPGPAPLSRSRFEEAVGKLFAAGDSNRDGTITLDEFNAVVEAARDRAIRDRFATIDSNRDQSLSMAEFAEWQRAMGSTVLAEDGPDTAGGALVAEEVRVSFGRGNDDLLAAGVVKPLTATALVEANTDYDAGVSLAELIEWESQAFAAVDQNGDGFIVDGELSDSLRK